MQTKVVPEFGDKRGIVREPGCMLTRGEGGFKPIEHSPMKVRQYIGNFDAIIGEGVWLVAEVQEALGQKGLEFMGIGAIELVWFSDLSMSRGWSW